MKTLTLRLDDEDHKLFILLADADDLPVATFIRRVIRQLAREKGLLATAHPTNTPATQSPTATTPITHVHDAVGTREDLLKRVEAGEQLRAVADSVGIQVSELQARLAKAKTARADGSLQRDVDMHAWKLVNPEPDDGKQYRLGVEPAHSGDGHVFSWKERTTAAATAPQPNRVLTPEEETERTNAQYRAMVLARDGTPVKVVPPVVDLDVAAKLDDLFP
jgi:hypothetical protein